MNYRVVFSPEAGDQLEALYRFLATEASHDVAMRYTEAIVSYCESLRTFPHRGTKRDDIRPNLRVTNYKKRVVIAFKVEADLISIIGIFYGGQNFETMLREGS
ncbi:Type II toxin-antitoxin system RelE/ParE family toxin [Sulfidibacter corallicola]|uniref:Type II toxin-antitoxin system RelE/ParE family toxin n=1 Tax=Sulfidibacter corallicola TaxID=2818388 RepID=A0A8A4THB9_SULCO|nr:type II toxin-antitoxin system RelE/ParE family toxin [Sulfidibacter corallicola]QTD49459.1 type II toxin-antitoxin system RelE/ParE family toxin [Sulfidibacter corallicola]